SIKYRHEISGLNSRLDELQSAVLRAKLRHLDAENTRRSAAASSYLDALARLPLQLPHVHEQAEPVWHLFVVRTPDRDALQAHLHAQGIGTVIHYPLACHRQPAYSAERWPALPLAERIQSDVLSLPMAPYLSTTDVRTVAACIRAFFA
ncbi:MAG: DegT/DnrJ/EryC1/StrS family aminotransferase, partial [Gammaproteobacteria bacterium]|nr:DegT/DnrJ/EryC1/StrS family aminotransferase [Gammaproteobacteria bacterium]